MSSPLFSEKAFRAVAGTSYGDSMTLRGTVDKSILLLFLTLLVPAVWIWNKMGADPEYAINNGIQSYMWGGLIIGLVSILVIILQEGLVALLSACVCCRSGSGFGFYLHVLRGHVSWYCDAGRRYYLGYFCA